ncbi:Peptidoglycan/LPS O-acetylase OafA/YrhL, contains acyltransferase and SGNH-hydrolase domains [Promicromonospora umidemergens]|uniref:Acyltransferase 3 domain-containing protein n=1 Tax=Promicromonospora umidemergens TaxID=629679 RepID=A0ABP8Y2W5_9MICO|nr:acyltransferase family protein [Promicromonospora umidemergens]MCP2282730.1 Peptidoglycan/LPS O-acetylase OafA/YrhL, contains acyltransferase and SGNH-hydrolase domains [Promicromonospora umidemergens]
MDRTRQLLTDGAAPAPANEAGAPAAPSGTEREAGREAGHGTGRDVGRPGGRGGHLPALDGLRGVAILGVLLFHAGHLGGGFLGVDLFFALSGYLITDLLLREIRVSGTVSLSAFWGRRVRRLLPALVTLLVGVTVLTWALGDTDLRRSALSDGPWVQANLVNWHLLGESAGYWEGLGASRVFGHLWSIAVEEQFYLVWPVVLLLVARRSRRVETWVAWTAVVVSVASLVLMLALFDPADTTRVYTGTDTRAFSLMLGALVATEPARRALERLVGRRAGVVLALLVAVLALLWWVADGEASPWLFQGGLFAHSLLAALVVVLCVRAPGSLPARAFGWRPLRALGLVSYSLYLWHWPVFLLLPEQRLGLTGWAHTLVVCAVSILLATLSTVLVENPVRFRARWAKGRSGLVAFVAAMVALALFWVVVPRPAGPEIDADAVGSVSESGASSGAELSTVLFMGDSIAAGEALPLEAAMTASGLALESIAADGGGGVVGPLAESTWADLPGAIASAEPDVIVYQLTTYDWGTEQQQHDGYERLVRTATDAGAELVFVPFPPIRPDDFYAPHMDELDRTADVAREVAAGSGGRAVVLDSSAVWGDTYQRERDGEPDRSTDGIHTCQQGAARFAGWLLGELATRYSGFVPADPQEWLDDGWAADARFKGC